MKIKVTYKPNNKTSGTKEIVEIIDLTPHGNGFVPDYKVRALAMNWTVIKVEKYKD